MTPKRKKYLKRKEIKQNLLYRKGDIESLKIYNNGKSAGYEQNANLALNFIAEVEKSIKNHLPILITKAQIKFIECVANGKPAVITSMVGANAKKDHH